MKRYSLFSLLYLITAAAFAVIGLAQNNLEVLLTAGYALLCAVCSLFRWWRQIIISMGKTGCFMIGAATIAITLTIQAYGLISQNFGFSYFLMGFLILMLISTVEDAVVLKNASRVSRALPTINQNRPDL